MAAKPNDARYMHQALELAQRGMALASPNPRVGAVLVSAEGKVVGRGSHAYDAIKHAEVLAIEAAGERAKGGTLYLNLEPCSHVGRTGPCADAIVEAGIKRVVCAMRDPNPLVAGRGFEMLRAAGIEVQEGLYEPEARKLNEAFAKYIRHKTPFVTLKTAMTLDGKIAPPPGDGITPGHDEFAGVHGRLDHQRSRARARARDAPRQRRHHGRRRDHHCRRPAANRPDRTAAAPAAVARDS